MATVTPSWSVVGGSPSCRRAAGPAPCHDLGQTWMLPLLWACRLPSDSWAGGTQEGQRLIGVGEGGGTPAPGRGGSELGPVSPAWPYFTLYPTSGLPTAPLAPLLLHWWAWLSWTVSSVCHRPCWLHRQGPLGLPGKPPRGPEWRAPPLRLPQRCEDSPALLTAPPRQQAQEQRGPSDVF